MQTYILSDYFEHKPCTRQQAFFKSKIHLIPSTLA